MPDYTSAYRTSAEQLVELIEQVPDEELTIMVPACPEWSVKDLIAHFAGVTRKVRYPGTQILEPRTINHSESVT